MGIGVQGLVDTFILMRQSFDSPELKATECRNFETIYFAAMESSMEIAQKEGPYKTYEGSPVSKGIFNSICGVLCLALRDGIGQSSKKVKKHGVEFFITSTYAYCVYLSDLRK